MKTRNLIFVFFTLIILSSGWALQAQETTVPPGIKPFIMPVPGASGPETYLVGQPYGNTTGAYAFGADSYSAGQYLHFGIDISMPCNTALVAVADGIVDSVDNMYRGSAPHNLLLSFPDLNLTVLYGHLLERPNLERGQEVRQGDFVAVSGDPDGNCDYRPHLHFEVRSMDFRTAYNPILYIDAPWHSLVGVGSFFRPLFQRDLHNARRWMSLEDQPNVQFGGRRLNNYSLTLPLPFNRRAPGNAPLQRPFTPVGDAWNLRQLGVNGCCAGAWWHPQDENRLFLIDGLPEQLASVYEVQIDQLTTPVIVQAAPPPILSSDGTHKIVYERYQTVVRRLSDETEWIINKQNTNISLSPDNELVLWSEGDLLRRIWIASKDGEFSKMVWESRERNASARWLDSDRLLITEREPAPGRFTTLFVVNIRDDISYRLGSWHNLRGMQIAPGGERLLFYSSFNTTPARNGVFALELTRGGTTQKLPWFGDYRWRDSESVFYLTYDSASDIQQLHYYHVISGDSLVLTDPGELPFTVANGDWSVSPNGNVIAFQEANDGNLWLLEATEIPTSSH